MPLFPGQVRRLSSKRFTGMKLGWELSKRIRDSSSVFGYVLIPRGLWVPILVNKSPLSNPPVTPDLVINSRPLLIITSLNFTIHGKYSSKGKGQGSTGKYS